jgi:uncharacterized membrane protein YhaH (DUF805 family)
MEKKVETEPRIKPWHAMLTGPLVGFLGLVVSLLVAPYVELHWAHFWLVILLIAVVSIAIPVGVVAMSDGPSRWNKKDEWPG